MKYISYIVFAFAILVTASCSKQDNGNLATASPDSGGTGQGGSLARFTIADDYLYVVDDKKLYAYSLANPMSPKLTSTQNIGEDIETIYSFKDKLFIGSQNAMYIYSIANGASPDKLGEASHVRACDPVIANEDVAYVTVRSGTGCGGTINALYVFDITNILSPRQKTVINMEGPWGLGMSGSRLYVCNGSSGMNIYDISNKYYPKLVQQIYDATYYDVIVYNDVLICMVEGGTLLYEIKGDGQIVKMGRISS
ncbi:MAG: hypothetical protein H6551_02285 [Chitinophagales bacterium]|nr:hypothetical protein [Chitinophagaceae bacterium]MCB9063952.1 hypothetical protein [Chitinophagales bacterium]